jgi:glycosyltransferase involved in cell wall biosynthesis
MKIGINALFLSTPTSGSKQYLLRLIDALAQIDTHNEYVLLGPQAIKNDGVVRGQAQDLPLQETVPIQNQQIPMPYRVYPVPWWARRNENIEKVVWEQWTGPASALKAGVDLMHVPHFAPPLLPRTPTIVTIHDVIPQRLPLYRAGGKLAAYMQLVARAARNATMIIAVSQHAKQDIIDVLHIPAERIRVIYEAAGDELRPVRDPALLEETRVKYGIGKNYIFYLGGLDQRKNVPRLVQAFAQLFRKLEQPDLQLFISGNPDKRGALFPDPRPVAEELGVADKVLFRFVEDEDKAAIYSGARLFVFPSLYEGFGLDPLEAMSCGAPVVCSNRTSLPEVVGDAAISVDPENTEALVEAMYRVLTNETLRAELCERSLQQSARFSWRKTASETLAVYEEVYARRKK